MEEAKIELWKKAAEKGSFFDDFKEKSPYWSWRTDNYAGFELENGVLKMYTGPTEALYYSNAEIADGSFEYLPWSFKTFEAKIRLIGGHYGSAGWGFWNYTMVVDPCIPIWFIYLRSRGPYPLQGFFAQVGNQFEPIILFQKSTAFKLASLLSRIIPGAIGVKILSSKPKMQNLKLEEWHIYRIEWKKESVNFHIDDTKVAEIPYKAGEVKTRADVWIDNAVFEAKKNDAGRVYRHVTQENRKRGYLYLDYLKVY